MPENGAGKSLSPAHKAYSNMYVALDSRPERDPSRLQVVGEIRCNLVATLKITAKRMKQRMELKAPGSFIPKSF